MAADKEHTMAMKTRDSTNTVVGPTFETQGWVFSMELFKDGEVWSDLRAPSSPACHRCRISRCRLHHRLPRQSPSTWTTPLQHHRTSRNRIKVISIENQWIYISSSPCVRSNVRCLFATNMWKCTLPFCHCWHRLRPLSCTLHTSATYNVLQPCRSMMIFPIETAIFKGLPHFQTHPCVSDYPS